MTTALLFAGVLAAVSATGTVVLAADLNAGPEVVVEVTPAEPRECIDLAAEAARIVAEEYQLPGAVVQVDVEGLCEQIREFPGKVDFLSAWRAALTSFLTDARDVESPLALAVDLAFADLGLPYTWPVPAPVMERAREILAEHLNQSSTKIRLLSAGESPEHGEEVTANWIVGLSVRSLSDHYFWAVADRMGAVPVYNYGFN